MSDMAYNAAKEALGSDKGNQKKKTHVAGIHIRKASSGGYIAKHEEEDEDGNPSGKRPEHVLPKMKDLVNHLRKHMPEEAAEIAAAKGEKGKGDEIQELD